MTKDKKPLMMTLIKRSESKVQRYVKKTLTLFSVSRQVYSYHHSAFTKSFGPNVKERQIGIRQIFNFLSQML